MAASGKSQTAEFPLRAEDGNAAIGPNHWGEWVIARWKFLGFRRLADLSTAVGCNPNLLTVWHQSESPPNSMRKGFDLALVRALRTDRMTLFGLYATIAPEDAPVIEPPRDVDRAGRNRIRRAPTARVA